MTIQEAIQKAIDGGWRINGETPKYVGGFGNIELQDKVCFEIDGEYGDCSGYPIESALMDPLFWKALGKSMGWDKAVYGYGPGMPKTYWESEWHQLINHLAAGGTIEDYFKNL